MAGALSSLDKQEYAIGGLVSRMARSLPHFGEARRFPLHLDNKKMWDATGFYRGIENRGEQSLRHEIDDSEASIKSWPERNDKNMSVADLIDHPELFDHYPRLKEIPVSLSRDINSSMAKDLSEMTLAPMSEVKRAGNQHFPAGMDDQYKPKSIAMHELQHAIQSIEGFDFGTNPTEAQQMLYRSVFEAAKTSPAMKKLLQAIQKNGWEKHHGDHAYLLNSGEQEARAVENRLQMPHSLRRLEMPLDSYNDPLDRILSPSRSWEENLRPALKVIRT